MIYFITSNKGKFDEAKKIVPGLEMLEMDLPEEQEVDQQKIIEKKLAMVADYLCSSAGRKRINFQPAGSPQTLLSHAEVASKGQRLASRNSGSLPAFIVEDTGFYLDCLPGLPGPLIKWFLKTVGRKGIYEICKKFDNYGAKGVTIIGYRSEKGEVKFFKGEVWGKVVLEKGGFEGGTRNGFGWDPVFVPEGEDRTFAEMNSDEKNEISMRRKAFEGLARHLDSKSQ